MNYSDKVVKAKVLEMNQLGIVKIGFNTEMKTDVILSEFDHTVMDIHVQPSNDWHIGNS
jgi:hypothetical protein